MLIHQSGFFTIGGPGGPVVFARYPVLPWMGLLAAGYEGVLVAARALMTGLTDAETAAVFGESARAAYRL